MLRRVVSSLNQAIQIFVEDNLDSRCDFICCFVSFSMVLSLSKSHGFEPQ
jgi:hypothetical protein